MEVHAYARFIRIAPRKVRLVVDLIRGVAVPEALVRLQTANKGASLAVTKLLKSAMANAAHNFKLDPMGLKISMIRVDEGPMLKRQDTRAQGRAEIIRKRTSHISLTLSSLMVAKKEDGESETTEAPTEKVAKKTVRKTTKKTS